MRLPAPYLAFRESGNPIGSFCSYSWTIQLDTDPVRTLAELPEEARKTFDHEFGHLLHYLTTYVGLSDLESWINALAAFQVKREQHENDEQVVTRTAREMLRIARNKQRLAIDDAYYYEVKHHLCDEAIDRGPGTHWQWMECVGKLFHTNGEISGQSFWALRFFLDERTHERSFMRIPLGLRGYLEHLANTIDVIGDLVAAVGAPAEFHEIGERLQAGAYHPDHLHYFALTHRTHSLMRLLYKDLEFAEVFLTTGQLVLLSSEVPYDDSSVWRQLIAAATKLAPPLAERGIMSEPHPSFVFPIVSAAFSSAKLELATLTDPSQHDVVAERLLEILELPKLSAIRQHVIAKRRHIRSIAKAAGVDEAVALLDWASAYDHKLDRTQKLVRPTAALGGESPVPIIFNDNSVIDGTVISGIDAARLLAKFGRYNEMLMFPIVRDIVP